MASEGSSSEASAGSSSSSAAAVAADSYIGSLISLTSKAEIRYEGVLVSINARDSTIALQNVKSYGTEGRKKDGPQVPPIDKVYEYILFRGSDIKDLQVKSSPIHTKPEVNSDPAIIQPYHAYAPSAISSPSIGGGALGGQSSYTVQPSLARPSFPDAFSLYQSEAYRASWGSSSASTSTNVTSTSPPVYWQGYFGSSGSQGYAQQQPFPLQPPSVMLQNQAQLAERHPPTSAPNFTELADPSTFSSAAAASHFGISNLADVSPSLPCDASQLSQPSSSLPSHLSTMPSFASFNQGLNASLNSVSGKAGPSRIPTLPVPTLPYTSPSLMGSTSAPPNTFPSLLTPDQLTQTKPAAPLVNPKLCREQEDMAAFLPPSSNTPSSVCQLPQEPLLPLPLPSQQGQSGVNQFNEEFDFTAMNEKFKKDEVWGSLGKGKQKNTPNGTEDSTIHDSSVVEDDYNQDPKFGSNPVYNKDDFFDNLSCNSLNRGAWNGRTRFSERMKLDTETFGDFQQRTAFGRGSHGAAYAGNFRGQYNRGRGHGYYSGRGRGGYRHI